jgi:hypothetical protein
MKRLITFALFLVGVIPFNTFAQENHGGALNLGLGLGGYSGYYGYVGRSFPVIHIDYEFNAVPNFTLAPFANFYTYSNNYFWSNDYYTYRETVIPIGVKGSFYFDDLLEASSEWDFYAAGSLGFAVVSRRWENGYAGDKNHYRGGSALFLDVHIGAEYHFNNRAGLFLDLSSGVSTIGLALH